MSWEELDPIPDVRLIHPQVHEEARGFFVEVLREKPLGARFVQANHSRSRAGVLRGLHYHRRQADAWYLVTGRAQVALADLRRSVPRPAVATLELSGDEPVVYIPPGVAHGYLALTDLDLIYWVTAYHDGTDEFGMAWNDPTLAVPWKVTRPTLSHRDARASTLDWNSVTSVLGRQEVARHDGS
jgi:dTDP-4-dehydrorhamnose 3,5-epimerase